MITNPKIGQLDITGASNGDVLSYVAANSSVEYVTLAPASDVETRVSANINAVQDNVAALDNNVWVNANDYTTYNSLSALIDTVNANVDALPDSAANDHSTYTTLAGLIDTVQDNVATQDNNVWVNANDHATYNSLSALIDTVQDNVDSVSSNTELYVGDTLLSNSAVIVEGGEGISVSADDVAHTVTITPVMANATSEVFAIDGTSNSFATAISVANTTMVLVSYNGLLQDPTRYSANTTHLNLNNTAPLTAGSNLELRYFSFFALQG